MTSYATDTFNLLEGPRGSSVQTVWSLFSPRISPTPNLAEALRYYRSAADDGFAGSQNNLGDLYEHGRGVAVNDKFAIYWFARAAERGEPTAYLSLSTLLPVGTSDHHILVEALKFALLAAERLPDGRNKARAKDNVENLKKLLSPDDIERAVDLASDWAPLYQERQLMSDAPDKSSCQQQ